MDLVLGLGDEGHGGSGDVSDVGVGGSWRGTSISSAASSVSTISMSTDTAAVYRVLVNRLKAI